MNDKRKVKKMLKILNDLCALNFEDRQRPPFFEIDNGVINYHYFYNNDPEMQYHRIMEINIKGQTLIEIMACLSGAIFEEARNVNNLLNKTEED